MVFTGVKALILGDSENMSAENFRFFVLFSPAFKGLKRCKG